jgi:hypothetical protein
MIFAAPIVILGLLFWAAAFLTRVISSLLEPKFLSWNQLIEFDTALGWKPKASLNTHYFIEGDDIFHIRTDFQGWAGKTSITESEMVVFGDSFAFGYGVNSEASFSELNPSLRIKPIGAPGYSMVQEVLLMRHLSSQLKGKLVVWFICLDNDLVDNITPSKPNYYRTPFIHRRNGADDWRIVTSHLSPRKWHYSSKRRRYYPSFANLCTPGLLSQHAYSACNFLIKEGRDVCRKAGAQLVVMSIPNKNQLSKHGLEFLASHLKDVDGFNPDFPDQQLDRICRNLGVPFVSLKDHLEVGDHKKNDVHWNERGHKRVSEVLYGVYKENVPERIAS